MPIYEFQCTKCRHLFEEFFTKLPERPTAKCPECGGKGKKLISNVGIVFKGAGFYVTDSRTSPAKGSSSSTTSKPETAPVPETPVASESAISEAASEPKADTGKSEKKGKSKSTDSGASDS